MSLLPRRRAIFSEKRHFYLAARGSRRGQGGDKPGTSRGSAAKVGTTKTSKNAVKTSTNATLGPHAPEVGPKMPRVGPKMPQDRPKMAPRGLQMASGPLQEPKMSPRCLQIAPRRPQHGTPEHGKRCSRLGAVHFLRNWPISVLPFAFLFSPVLSQPNLASRWPEDGPRMPQDGSRMAPGKSKIVPRWPRQTPGWPKKGPRRHGQTPR